MDEMKPSGLAPADIPAAPACTNCGLCCLSLPGAYYPADLGRTWPERVRRARELLESGWAAVDAYDGRDDFPTVYFLRPATVRAPGRVIDLSWGGACVNLERQGCRLARPERPSVCKSLRPGQPGLSDCVGLTKRDIAEAWRHDSAWLFDLACKIAEAREKN